MSLSRKASETVALQAAAWLAANDELLPVFVGSTGCDEEGFRTGLTDPEFQISILEFLLLDDAWVVAFCDDASLPYEAVSDVLKLPVHAILEDIGTYLISHPKNEPIRRLMRFGGADFVEFLHSMDDLPGRTRLALPGLRLPSIHLEESTPMQFTVSCTDQLPGFGHVLVGLLRAMADDYGALAVLEYAGRGGPEEVVDIQVLDASFVPGRSFSLADCLDSDAP